ncbi:hypothetical protein OSTOST_21930 [Ostertagia ostertagi]
MAACVVPAVGNYDVCVAEVFGATMLFKGHEILLAFKTLQRCGIKAGYLRGSLLEGNRGNYFGAPIYEVGEPCSKCNCEGCKCNKDDGLCVTP